MGVSVQVTTVGSKKVGVDLRKGGMLIIKAKGDNVTTARLLYTGNVSAMLFSKGGRLSSGALCRGTPGLGRIPLVLNSLASRRVSRFSITILDPKMPASVPVIGSLHSENIGV